MLKGSRKNKSWGRIVKTTFFVRRYIILFPLTHKDQTITNECSPKFPGFSRWISCHLRLTSKQTSLTDWTEPWFLLSKQTSFFLNLVSLISLIFSARQLLTHWSNPEGLCGQRALLVQIRKRSPYKETHSKYGQVLPEMIQKEDRTTPHIPGCMYNQINQVIAGNNDQLYETVYISNLVVFSVWINK